MLEVGTFNMKRGLIWHVPFPTKGLMLLPFSHQLTLTCLERKRECNGPSTFTLTNKTYTLTYTCKGSLLYV